MKDIAEACVSVIRMKGRQQARKRYSTETATKIYGEELAARLLGNQKSLVSNHNPRKGFKKGPAKKEETRKSGNLKDDVLFASETGLVRYLTEIKQFPMLEQQEEYELAKRWREHGDYAAREKLITSHLRMVPPLVRKNVDFNSPQSSVEDFSKLSEDKISEGNIALIQAVEAFNPDNGARLSSLAIAWIRPKIYDYSRNFRSLVKVGTTNERRKLFSNLRKEKQRLRNQIMNYAKHLRLPSKMSAAEQKLFSYLEKEQNRFRAHCSNSETISAALYDCIHALINGDMWPDQVQIIAERLKVTEQDVIEINHQPGPDVRLHMQISKSEEGKDEWISQVAADNTLHDIRGRGGAWWFGSDDQESLLAESEHFKNQRETLDQVLENLGDVLNEREHRIFIARQLIDKPLTLEELANEFDISRERVRQIEKGALEKVKNRVLEKTRGSLWYPVHVHSKFEYKVAESIREQVRLRGLSHLVEKIAVRMEKRPGCVFIKMKLTDEVRSLLKDTPKVAIKNNRLEPLSDDEVDSVFHQTPRESPSLGIKVGDRVSVVNGPFATYTGIVEEVDEARLRLKVALDGAVIHRVNLRFEQVVHHGG